MAGFPDTYYAATRSVDSHWSQLPGRIDVDVAVIGGGLAGLTTARELALVGKSVALLESRRIGFGASGRNGGFVSAGFAEGAEHLVRKLGLDHARALYDLSHEGVSYIADAIRDLEMTGVDPVPGWLNLVRYDNEEAMRTKAEKLASISGREVSFWPTDKVLSHLKTNSYFQGIYDPGAFHIHPLNYALQLAVGAERAGARIFENTAVLSMVRNRTDFSLNCARGGVRANQVVMTGSAYLGRLYPRLARAVLPVATHVIVSAPLRRQQAQTIQYDGAITDSRRAGDYYRLLPDSGDGRRLLWGGRITTQKAEPRRLAALMKRDVVSVYPQLADMRIDYAWSGLMGYAIHKMPLIGLMEPGVWACTAFGGHGLNTTAMGGILIAGAIAIGDDRYRLFDPFKARWGGGATGRVATQAAYWAMQLADRWEELRSR